MVKFCLTDEFYEDVYGTTDTTAWYYHLSKTPEGTVLLGKRINKDKGIVYPYKGDLFLLSKEHWRVPTPLEIVKSRLNT